MRNLYTNLVILGIGLMTACATPQRAEWEQRKVNWDNYTRGYNFQIDPKADNTAWGYDKNLFTRA